MKKFYDIHMHAFNLSHPNLLAFVARMNIKLLLMTTPITAPLMKLIGKDKTIVNILTMMENNIGDYFLVLEYYLRRSAYVQGNILSLGDGTQYQKIVLTPLVMDFGYKNIMSNSFYQLPAQKPIIEQIDDLVDGVNKYISNDFDALISPEKTAGCIYSLATKESKLFEIYPFLGINTVNYKLDKVEEILSMFFSTYTKDPYRLYNEMGSYNCFAGIKLYPPLGFDPMPSDSKEREKVDMLYSFCCAHDIPITAHCSDGGFVVTDKAAEYTSPDKWEAVLKQYPKLKLNLAHTGKQSKKKAFFFSKDEWHKKVLKLIADYENVYMDISCMAFDNSFYKDLMAEVHSQYNAKHLINRILFGSDFMVNLLWCESYNSYIESFCKTEHLTNSEKDCLCSANPEKFLFG
jgi:hypothetical protein